MAFETQWADWLSVEAAGQRGGIVLTSEAIIRGMAWTMECSVDADYSADAFKAWMRIAPDAAGAAIECTVVVGAYGSVTAGETPITLSLTKVQVATLPTDNDGNGLEEVLLDVLHTPSGGDQYRWFAVSIPVSGKVTDGD